MCESVCVRNCDFVCVCMSVRAPLPPSNKDCTSIASVCVCVSECVCVCVFVCVCLWLVRGRGCCIRVGGAWGWWWFWLGGLICVCVCVRVHPYTHSYVYIYVCVCVCVVCAARYGQFLDSACGDVALGVCDDMCGDQVCVGMTQLFYAEEHGLISFWWVNPHTHNDGSTRSFLRGCVCVCVSVSVSMYVCVCLCICVRTTPSCCFSPYIIFRAPPPPQTHTHTTHTVSHTHWHHTHTHTTSPPRLSFLIC